MSQTDTSKTAHYAVFDGVERKFQLRIGEIGELERRCNAGIGAIMVRLASHQFYRADIWETIRLGMEGGGESKANASAIALRFQDEPLSDYIQLAADILSAAVSGVKREGEPTTEGSPEAPATSPSSTVPGER